MKLEKLLEILFLIALVLLTVSRSALCDDFGTIGDVRKLHGGFGFIEGMRADPNHRTTPCLVLTTESDAEKKARARAAGATGWIVKPFDPVKLVDAVRRVAA